MNSQINVLSLGGCTRITKVKGTYFCLGKYGVTPVIGYSVMRKNPLIYIELVQALVLLTTK
jgi:hypothetical protein